jgi:hypothetical protein
LALSKAYFPSEGWAEGPGTLGAKERAKRSSADLQVSTVRKEENADPKVGATEEKE